MATAPWSEPSLSPPPLIKGRESDLPKIESLRGGGDFARKGNKPEKRLWGVDVEWGVATFLLFYSSIQSHLL